MAAHININHPLNAESFYPCIHPYIDHQHLYIGLSGGIDSIVLLHLLTQFPTIKDKLEAIYINHQLSPDSGAWAEFCASICRQYSVSFQSYKVNAHPKARQSPEAAARDARYQQFARLLNKDDCLLTAHHANDQSETLLLQLFRGSGSRGLASMRKSRRHEHFRLARPLLSFNRDQIQNYAGSHQLQWIEDESNLDTRIKRNFLRHIVLPLLTKQWPAIHQTLNRAALIQSETDSILQEVAEQDLNLCRGVSDLSFTPEPSLSREKLLSLSRPRIKNCLQRWLRQQHAAVLNAQLLERFMNDFIDREATADTELYWDKMNYLRYYRDNIYFSHINRQLKPVSIDWDFTSKPQLVCKPFVLLASSGVQASGLKTELLQSKLSIHFRRGGEVYQKYRHSAHFSLKNWFQENHVPPWLRPCLPLIYHQQDLIQIGNQVVNRSYQQKESINSLTIQLTIL